MKVGLLQIDGKMPNLALLQIAQYHLNQGDSVQMYVPFARKSYGKIYASKIFNFSNFPSWYPKDAILGGTGVDPYGKLPEEIENTVIQKEAWDAIYPKFEPNLGFSMKGCRFKCDFCVVPKKEGRPIGFNSVSEIMVKPSNKLILLDNDFFGGPRWEETIQEIIEKKIEVCFQQGLNIRILKPKQADYLAQCDFWNVSFKYKQVTFAWDKYKDKKLIQRGIDLCLDAGIKAYKMQFFVLVGFDTSPEEDLERVEYLRSRGCDIFVMRMMERESYETEKDFERTKHFQRWVNRRWIFNKCTFKEYCKEVGFKE